MTGDMDGNLTVDSTDALAILRASADMITLDSSGKLFADVDRDGSVTAQDALYTLRYSVGFDNPEGAYVGELF